MSGLQELAFLNHADDRMDFQPLWIGLLAWLPLALAIALAIDIFGETLPSWEMSADNAWVS